jgi:outer membrane protein assembly factor BamB
MTSISQIVLASSAALWLTGCDMFKEKIVLSGKRETFLTLDSAVLPDPMAARTSVLLTSKVPNTDWPQAGGNAAHVMPNLALSQSLGQIWSTSVGSGGSEDHRITSGPVIANGILYTCDALGKIFAIEAKGGKILWSVDPLPVGGHASDAIGGGVAYDAGLVYSTTSFGELLALQAQDGKIVWRKPLGAPSRIAPTLKDGKVYALTINNEIHAFAAKTGDSLWTHSGISEAAGILGGASPAVCDGVAIAVYSSGEIFAFQAHTGEPIWGELLNPALRIDSVASIAHIRARPVIDGGVVYVISHGGQMVALDLKTGQRLWQRDIGGIRTPALMGDSLFMVTNDADLLCIQKATGQIRWAIPLPKVTQDDRKPILWAGPIIAGDALILAGSHGKLILASPKDGMTLKILDMPDSSNQSPIVAEGALYVLTDDATLVKYSGSK